MRAEISRVESPRSVCTTTTIVPDDANPIVRNRSSSAEWSASKKVKAKGSEKTVVADSNEMPCFRRFVSAFSWSQSNGGKVWLDHVGRVGVTTIG